MKIKENFLLFLLAAVNFTHIMDFVIMAPLSAMMRKPEALDITTKQFSILLASYTISAALSGIAGSFFIDRFNRRNALLFLYIGFTLSNILCSVSNDYFIFMAGRVLAGGFGGILGSLLFSVIGDVVPAERRGKATGIVMAAFAGASVLGIPTGLTLADMFFWQAPFVLLSGLSVLVLILLYFKFPSLDIHLQRNNPLTPFQNIVSILKDSNLQFSMAFMVILMIAGLSVVPFLSDYLVNNTGVKQEDLRYIYIFGGIASVVVGPLAGTLSDKFGKRSVYITAALLSIGPMWIMTHMDARPLWQLLIFSTIFFIAFGARFVPAMAMITSSVDMMRRGSFMSLNSSVQQMGSSLAVGIAGLILSNGPNNELINFDVCGIVAIAATIATLPLAFNIKQVS